MFVGGEWGVVRACRWFHCSLVCLCIVLADAYFQVGTEASRVWSRRYLGYHRPMEDPTAATFLLPGDGLVQLALIEWGDTRISSACQQTQITRAFDNYLCLQGKRDEWRDLELSGGTMSPRSYSTQHYEQAGELWTRRLVDIQLDSSRLQSSHPRNPPAGAGHDVNCLSMIATRRRAHRL